MGCIIITPEERKKRNRESGKRIDPEMMKFIEDYNRRADQILQKELEEDSF